MNAVCGKSKARLELPAVSSELSHRITFLSLAAIVSVVSSIVICAAPGAALAEPVEARSTADASVAVQGTIVDDATGRPLSDCNVVVEGTSAGTTSDAQGVFRLPPISGPPVVLIVSRVGYETRRVKQDPDWPFSALSIRLRPAVLRSPEITVTATRAKERETPAAFSNLSREEIQARYHAEDVPVLLSELPSTTYYSDSGNGIGYTYLSIRGFDQRRISVLINGVPQNDPEDHNVYWVDFPDMLSNVQDIQVQRGSGMAFYGPPAIGGSVNILTEAPPAERRASAAVGGGSYGTRRMSLQLASGLLASRYVLEGRVSRIESDGYRERSWVDFKSYFVSASRLGDRSVTRVNVYAGPVKDHLAYYGISKEKSEDASTRRENPISRPDEVERFDQPHFEILNEFHPRSDLEITNTVFGVRGYGYYDYDGSWAPMSYFRLTSKYGFALPDSAGDETFVDSLLIRAYVDNRQLGWLPQVTWRGRHAEVTAGAELRAHRSLHWGRIQRGDSALPTDTTGAGLDYVGARHYYDYRASKDVVSPYIHTVIRPMPHVSAILDLQYAHLRYRLYDERFLETRFAVPYEFWNPRAGINVNLTERWNTFASYARTSREPRLKNLYDAAEASTPESWGVVAPQFETGLEGGYDFDRPLVKPERLDDFEAGLGYRAGARHAVLDLYRMDFHDEIISQGRLDRFGQPVTGNADRTRHEGVEVSVAGPVMAGFSVSANLMVSRNELVHYAVYVYGESTAVPVVLDGNTIAGFPGVLANLRVSYGRGGASLSVVAQHVGKQYTDQFENEVNTVDAFTVVQTTASYGFQPGSRLAGLSAQVQVRNLFDKLYNGYGEGEAFFPAARRQFFGGLRYSF